MKTTFDTIAAIATPPGPGGIAIVRLSGPAVLSTAARLFIPASGKADFVFSPRHMHYGFVTDIDGGRLDEVLAVFMPGPHSATGEDVLEIQCHGGPAITAAILEAVLQTGARLADPGEFTRRAFLTGRIDLSQAEAVAEAIAAPSRQGARLAHAKLSGALSRVINDLRSVIDALRVDFAAALDFPDEEGDIVPRDRLLEQIASIKDVMRQTIAGYERAKMWREGASVVLAGQVNAGKSSLLNALLGRERAIVSPQPGTTRDYIEETVLIEGMPLRFVDTAGLRTSRDRIEEEGIRRAVQLADDADLILLVVDSKTAVVDKNGFEAGSAEAAFMTDHKQHLNENKLIIVCNKADIDHDMALAAQDALTQAYGCPVCVISARNAQGLDELGRQISEALLGGETLVGSDIAPNLRQTALLQQALTEMDALEMEIEALLPLDIISLRLDAAAHALDEVIGVAATDDLLGVIFSSFCIGK